jgi:hypothetical protein
VIDTLGMLLCIAGYGFLSFGLPRIGFVISATGSGFWFMFGLAVSSKRADPSVHRLLHPLRHWHGQA